jgi:hypothetical protein
VLVEVTPAVIVNRAATVRQRVRASRGSRRIVKWTGRGAAPGARRTKARARSRRGADRVVMLNVAAQVLAAPCRTSPRPTDADLFLRARS